MDLTANNRERLKKVLSYFRNPRTFDRLWHDVLSAEERRTVEENSSPLELVGTYAKSRKVSFERAIVDMAMQASVISVAEHMRLRKRLEEPIDILKDEDRPSWNKKTSELTYKGVIIRHVVGRASNLRTILQAFQEDRWERHIYNPLPGGKNSKKLRKTLYDFNRRTSGIRLFPDGKASGIGWEETETGGR